MGKLFVVGTMLHENVRKTRRKPAKNCAKTRGNRPERWHFQRKIKTTKRGENNDLNDKWASKQNEADIEKRKKKRRSPKSRGEDGAIATRTRQEAHRSPDRTRLPSSAAAMAALPAQSRLHALLRPCVPESPVDNRSKKSQNPLRAVHPSRSRIRVSSHPAPSSTWLNETLAGRSDPPATNPPSTEDPMAVTHQRSRRLSPAWMPLQPRQSQRPSTNAPPRDRHPPEKPSCRYHRRDNR